MEAVLTVEVRAGRGVDRVVVEFDPGRRGDGLVLLQRALPALQELDRLSREKASAGVSV